MMKMASGRYSFSIVCILLLQLICSIRTESIVNDTELDPCEKVQCEDGEICLTNSEGKAECSCFTDCEDPKDERLAICTKNNQTYTSDCEFYRMQCWCRTDDSRCIKKETLNDTIDYFGKCQDLGSCSAFELKVFPERMSLWLGETLNALFDKKSVDQKYESLIDDARAMKVSKAEKWWRNAVLWAFCDLDRSHDKSISSEEMHRFVRSLKILEHCIQPFLDSCDADKNEKISSDEWGTCLGLEKNDMNLLKSYCSY